MKIELPQLEVFAQEPNKKLSLSFHIKVNSPLLIVSADYKHSYHLCVRERNG